MPFYAIMSQNDQITNENIKPLTMISIKVGGIDLLAMVTVAGKN